jgi:hypothetical protein
MSRKGCAVGGLGARSEGIAEIFSENLLIALYLVQHFPDFLHLMSNGAENEDRLPLNTYRISVLHRPDLGFSREGRDARIYSVVTLR